MILILTNKQDTHTDDVVREFQKRNVEVFRLNTEDFLLKYKTTLEIDRQGLWSGHITDEIGRVLNLETLRVAWYRKPEFDFLVDARLNPEVRGFVSSEARALIDTLYSIPNLKWINDPFLASKSKVKFQQLLLARELGVRIPRTIITNEPNFAKIFVDSCDGDIITKSIYTSNVIINGINQGVLTKRLDMSDFSAASHNIALAPTKLQEHIDKEFELRITVIGKKVFAVKIDSQSSEKTKVDWREYTALCKHSIFDIPINIQKFCREFLQRQNLDYGAMDFIVTPDAEYVFLENNPFGQYLWLERETGIQLTNAICDLLLSYK